ncbi:MAG: hypothetical protein P1U80_11065 [Pseudomonadales bacterium]|jgi:hypothetical protein|nr:hypothetical protein [Pseudomonadales bacterium]
MTQRQFTSTTSFQCLLIAMVVVLSLLSLYSEYSVAEERNVQGGESTVSYRFGYRYDQLDWNIASDLSGSFTPNILSELTWDEVRSAQLEINLSGLLSNRLYYRVSVALASTQKGENQDSDYDGNDRSLEFSRSNNNSSNGYLGDASGAIGYPIVFGASNAPSLRITPLVGYSYHRQDFTMTDGMQTIASSGRTPVLGPITGLDSSYQAEWYGPWWGIELVLGITPDVEISLLFEHHEGEYLGVGNWNLRSDFQHPKSFEHVADARGDLVALNLMITSNYSWRWLFSAQLQDWRAEPGIDRIFFSDNTIAVTRLNEVNWQATSVSVGFLIPF